MEKETYLGDGLYASFDGEQVCLRAPRDNGDHVVFLEPGVLTSLEGFIADVRKLQRAVAS